MSDKDESGVQVESSERQEPDAEAIERRREALAEIVKFGDPVLRSRASDVENFDEALRQEVSRMILLMQDGMGVGLAATQLGKLRRLLVFQAGPDAEPRALSNPEIVWASEETEVAEEGCLSIPSISLDVDRPLHVRIEGRDEWGDEIEIEASGLEARVLQHEIDHLDGILILDRAPKQQKRDALRAIRRDEEYHPPGDLDGHEARSV